MGIFEGVGATSKGTIKVLVILIIALSLAITTFIVVNNVQKFVINSANSGIQGATGNNPDVVNSGGALSPNGNSDYDQVWDKSEQIYGDRGQAFFDSFN